MAGNEEEERVYICCHRARKAKDLYFEFSVRREAPERIQEKEKERQKAREKHKRETQSVNKRERERERSCIGRARRGCHESGKRKEKPARGDEKRVVEGRCMVG